MAKIKLRWTRLAVDDLTHAHDYIRERRPSAAVTVIERIEAALAALREHPQIGRLGRISSTRELVVTGTPFILCYRPHDRVLEILAILHNSRRWPESF